MFAIQCLLIIFFLLASSVKVFGWIKPVFEIQLSFFHRYGLNRVAMFLVGVIEASGAMALLIGLINRHEITSTLGATLIAITSLGAMCFHFRFDTIKDAIPSMITLVLSLMVAGPVIYALS